MAKCRAINLFETYCFTWISAYFKTERILKKASEKYEAAVAEEKREGPSELKLEVAVRIVMQAFGLLLLHSVSGIYAFCIPSVAFWPINVLLRFPSIWSSDQCGGEDFVLAPVSIFAAKNGLEYEKAPYYAGVPGCKALIFNLMFRDGQERLEFNRTTLLWPSL
uniref:Uncharacterized protein n=1 Tax=Angiostrongylus cantonensis TaxID=6313 RepID=A0A0K0D6F9_ANGCA